MKKKINFQIFKSLTDANHAQNISNGTLILRSPDYYRIYIDQNEFTIFNGKTSISLVPNALIFCCHKNYPIDKPYIVTIDNPCNLFEEIKENLKDAMSPSHGAYFGDVKYEKYKYEDSDNDKNFDIRKINFYCNKVYTSSENNQIIEDPSIECAYYKENEPKFVVENEIRMCFLICPEKLSNIKNKNVQVIFYKRYYDNSCKEHKEKIDYNQWKSTRNERNSWFEINLNVKKDYFSIHSSSHTD